MSRLLSESTDVWASLPSPPGPASPLPRALLLSPILPPLGCAQLPLLLADNSRCGHSQEDCISKEASRIEKAIQLRLYQSPVPSIIPSKSGEPMTPKSCFLPFESITFQSFQPRIPLVASVLAADRSGVGPISSRTETVNPVPSARHLNSAPMT